MRTIVFCWFLVLACVVAGFAQRRVPGNGSVTPNAPVSPDFADTNRSIYITGRVSIEGGRDLTEPAEIRANCGGQRRANVYTDWKGRFSFLLGSGNRVDSGINVADASSSQSGSPSAGIAEMRSCQVEAVLAGYSSRPLDLSGSLDHGQSMDVGVILLHPLGNVPAGFAISATSAAAPDSAKKALAKGMEQKRKQKWADAERSFESAVKIYPAYALAWSELGVVQLQQSKPDAARESFRASVAADSKFVNPYLGLAELAMHDHKWSEAVDATNKALALDPTDFPNAWFYNGAANYNLGNYDAAEKSVREVVLLDKEHHFPKSELLLGLILAEKKAYPEATEHIQQYQHLTTDPKEISDAQQQLDRLAKLSGSSEPAKPVPTPQ